jgi:hypothetical protein
MKSEKTILNKACPQLADEILGVCPVFLAVRGRWLGYGHLGGGSNFDGIFVGKSALITFLIQHG